MCASSLEPCLTAGAGCITKAVQPHGTCMLMALWMPHGDGGSLYMCLMDFSICTFVHVYIVDSVGGHFPYLELTPQSLGILV